MMTLREHAAGEEGSRAFRQLLGLIAVLMCCSWGSAQQWVTVRQPFPGKAGLALLRTDGKVMVEETATGWWWLLVPDDTGSYTDGVWIASGLPLSNYDPTGFASAVLPDGRIIVEGGEHNFGQKVETTVGAIFDPTTGVWTEVPLLRTGSGSAMRLR